MHFIKITLQQNCWYNKIFIYLILLNLQSKSTIQLLMSSTQINGKIKECIQTFDSNKANVDSSRDLFFLAAHHPLFL